MDPTDCTADGRLESEVSALCISRLNASGRPWYERHNHKSERVFSCMQAARVRDRLGSGANGGIPLWCELKSIVGMAVSSDIERPIAFAAHTRANTRIDSDLLICALGLHPERTFLRSPVDEDAEYDDHPLATIVRETRERWRGLVNPFTVDRVLSDFEDADLAIADVVQVFDVSLCLNGGLPDSVMTNLGDRTRAMELLPADLIGAVQEVAGVAAVHKFAVPCPIWLGQSGTYRKDVFMKWPPPSGPRIGILTGNGPESGMSLWRTVVAGIRQAYDYVPDVFMPEVVVHSVPGMGLSMELAAREPHVREIVVRGIRDLLQSGCKLVTIACNTTIYFEPEIAELCAAFGARFISIAEAVVPAVSRQLARQPPGVGVGLIGIGPVIDIEGGYSGYRQHLEDAGIAVTTCAADEFAFEIKNQPEHKKRMGAFGKLVKSLPDAAVVILALTEASIIYQEYALRGKNHSDQRVYVDAVEELGAYLAFTYLSEGYLDSQVCQIAEESAVSWSKLQKKFGWADEHPPIDPEATSTA